MVQWVSGSNSSQVVQWKLAKRGKWAHTSPSVGFTYSAADLCGAVAANMGFRSPGYM